MTWHAAYAPATVGNVGPGFDVLGLAVDGLGDTVRLRLRGDASMRVEVEGRDAEAVPREPERNAAAIAARAYLDAAGDGRGFELSLHKGLPLSGGMGGSAASSVAGALAAALAREDELENDRVLRAAAEGERAVAGFHLDNLAPCLWGGLVLVRSAAEFDLLPVPVRAGWWVGLLTPRARVETRAARAVLPQAVGRDVWVPQMANTAALVLAFSRGDAALARRALRDGYAEPARAHLVPHFAQLKAAALTAGALGCSISGAGPTVFALAERREVAEQCVAAMRDALGEDQVALAHAGAIDRRGARRAEDP